MCACIKMVGNHINRCSWAMIRRIQEVFKEIRIPVSYRCHAYKTGIGRYFFYRMHNGVVAPGVLFRCGSMFVFRLLQHFPPWTLDIVSRMVVPSQFIGKTALVIPEEKKYI